MKITNIKKITYKNICRLEADIIMDNQTVHNLFFEVDKKYAPFVYSDGTPFVAVGLLPAMKRRENITVDGSVSPAFLKNLKTLMGIFSSWNVGFESIEVTASLVSKVRLKKKQTGLFFSGGVDSFYSLLRLNKYKKTVTHLIFTHGMDIPFSDSVFFNKAALNVQLAAKALNCEVVLVKTNVREFTGKHVIWDFAHGGVIAGVSSFLQNGFSDVFISGGMQDNHLRPLGVHPHTDRYWSTDSLSIHHFGNEVDRLEKIRSEISSSDVALSNLRVCWRGNRSNFNCSKCEKCIRTMVSLRTCGVLHKARTFKPEIDIKVLQSLSMVKNHIRYFQENLDELEKQGKDPELCAALREVILKNKKRTFLFTFNYLLRKKIGELDEKLFGGNVFLFMTKNGFI